MTERTCGASNCGLNADTITAFRRRSRDGDWYDYCSMECAFTHAEEMAVAPALEADTVSRAELNEANAAWHERWMRDQKLIEKLNHDSVEAAEQLTALQAELETEKAAVRCYMADLETARARAEEAERSAGEQLGLRLDLTKELAAANARVARLEEAVSEVLSVHGFLGVDAAGREEQRDSMLRLREQALSTAPQASTEQASPSPAVGEVCSCGSPPHYPKPCEPAQPAPSPAACWPGAGFIVRVTSSGRDTAVREPAQPAPFQQDFSGSAHAGVDQTPPPSSAGGNPEPAPGNVSAVAASAGGGGEVNPPRWGKNEPSPYRPAQHAPGGTERCEACQGDGLTGYSLGSRDTCQACSGLGLLDPTPAEPGGTERWVPKVHDVVRGSARKPRGCFEGSGVIVEIFDPSNTLPIHVKWDNGSRGNYAQVELEPLPDPTPAEPQGRPDISECPKCGGTFTDEHEGTLCPPCDYVKEQGRPEQVGECPPGFRQIPVYSDSRGTLSMGLGGLTTIRACQHCGVLIAGGPTACVHCVRVADRLEGK